MPFFPCAHAGNPSWQHTVKQVVVQLNAQMSMQKLEDVPCLGVAYISECFADVAGEMVAMLSQALPQVQHWVGCAGHSVLAGDLDYGSSGALAVMLTFVPAHSYQVFAGLSPQMAQHFAPHYVLVHGDAVTGSAQQHLQDLSHQLQCQRMVGGISDLQTQHVQWAWGSGRAGTMPASIGGGGVQFGGLSGVAFSQGVDCLAVGMQACKPQGSSYTITKTDGPVVLELDGREALDVLSQSVDWGSDPTQQAQDSEQAIGDRLQQALVAISPPHTDIHSHCVAPQARVVRVTGVDWQRRGIALHGGAMQGSALTLCQHDEQAARADLRRACAQVWDALTSEITPGENAGQPAAAVGRSISGAIYIRNHARQHRPRVPQLDAELELIRHALGPVPLLGFTSSYEVDGAQLHHLSAQLLVFTQPLRAFT